MATSAIETRSGALATAANVADAVRACYDKDRPVYPVGARTAIDYGGYSIGEGYTLDLAKLNRVVDYTPRDMTIVVEPGVRMGELSRQLAAEKQQLPIDVPRAAEATIGGVVATNWSGPRRFGFGTVRDYLIGIHAVDGRGIAFKGGGRVVKNVAGYDFCKLLTGSMGTLGVITQLAFKVKPVAESTATVWGRCANLASAGQVLNHLAQLALPAASIDLLIGKGWDVDSDCKTSSSNTASIIIARVEGTESEVAWLVEQYCAALGRSGCSESALLPKGQAVRLWQKQVEFSDRGTGAADDNSPMVVKIAVPASEVTKSIEELIAFDPECTIQAYAGSGIIVARFAIFREEDLSKVLISRFRPAAIRRGGSLVIVRSKLVGITPHVAWGGRSESTVLLERIKRQFDPKNILNPHRFAYY